MNILLARNSYDPRQREIRRLGVSIFAILLPAIVWHSARDDVIYHAARNSIGCPGRVHLIAAGLRHVDPDFPDKPRFLRYNRARPEWIAWSIRREVWTAAGWRSKWQTKVADSYLTIKGVIVVDGLSAPPADPDRDGSCEIMKEYYPDRDEPRKDLRWWTVVRLGEEDNEIVWAGLIDNSIWRPRQNRLKPIWRDTDGNGLDELVFITLEAFQTSKGGIAYKPSRTIAVFEWTAPGGILRTRTLPDDCGIRPWSPEGGVPMRVGQETDLDPVVRKLLSVPETP